MRDADGGFMGISCYLNEATRCASFLSCRVIFVFLWGADRRGEPDELDLFLAWSSVVGKNVFISAFLRSETLFAVDNRLAHLSCEKIQILDCQFGLHSRARGASSPYAP